MNLFEKHQKAAIGHAISRAKDRLSIRLTANDVMRHCIVIWSGKTIKLGDGAVGRELHLVDDGGERYLAVFDPGLRRIVTYLSFVNEWRGSLTPAGQKMGHRAAA
jgi:hypothetical protein